MQKYTFFTRATIIFTLLSNKHLMAAEHAIKGQDILNPAITDRSRSAEYSILANKQITQEMVLQAVLAATQQIQQQKPPTYTGTKRKNSIVTEEKRNQRWARPDSVQNELKKFKCDEQNCTWSFGDRSNLARHIRARHKLEKKATCQQCPATFLFPYALKKHIEVVHQKKRLFSCSYCGHAGSTQYYITQHERKHTGEKPYECDQCFKRFSIHSSAKRHLMVHNNLGEISDIRKKTLPSHE